MRVATVVGALLLILGGIVLTMGIKYPDSKTVVDLGDLKAKVTEHRKVPQWVGIVALAGGAVLLVMGTMGGRRAAH